MSASLRNTRRLLTATALAAVIAALMCTVALASPRAHRSADTDGWYRYAVSLTRSSHDGWYRSALAYTAAQKVQASAPVSDVESSLQAARQARIQASIPVSDVESSLQAARQARTQASAPISGVINASAPSTSDGSSFSWTAAGIGAAATLTATFLALAGRVALNRRRRPLAF
jgi:hypothetical protein